jgi:UDP-N-acetyl-D-galactosamine dehydrogenase
LNDSMGEFSFPSGVTNDWKGVSVNGATIYWCWGLPKENCPDVRNTKIVDVIESLTDYGISVTTYDPLTTMEVKHEYALKPLLLYPINDLMR